MRNNIPIPNRILVPFFGSLVGLPFFYAYICFKLILLLSMNQEGKHAFPSVKRFGMEEK